ncbi:MAG: hypothetical protein A3K09_01145 [Nitrospinae bacterium RIFCSPLOWO2_12_FULL_47_7]|nr:MAG: hypothetical protein A3K09_01145 [Nitrospinae bacterium RIFCSPLOWO2_12_FULL_47_7]
MKPAVLFFPPPPFFYQRALCITRPNLIARFLFPVSCPTFGLIPGQNPVASVILLKKNQTG